jgi:uncharacterized membrane protein
MQNLPEPSGKQRIESIDILRGVIMLIMALDHCRDFFHIAGPASDPTNMATTTPILFFTRFITHFCAPTFVFLSGVSAYLAGLRRTKAELSSFLIKRGLWLVLVELVVLTFAFTFNPFYNVFILQVLWAIGISMIILGLLVRAPMAVIGVIGAFIFFGHDILDYVTIPEKGTPSVLMNIFFTARGTFLSLDKSHFVADLYAIIPWTGIMLLGYVCGQLYNPSFNPEKRRNILRATGLALLVLFLFLRIFNFYGDPDPWTIQRNWVHTVLSFFNVSKYPPSLLYSCMTVGTALTILSFTEHIKNKVTSIFVIYGNVPFFYYVLHFYLIHIICVILFFASGYNTSQIVPKNGPFLFHPDDFGYSLGIVYLIWLFVITVLYWPCKWFSKFKKTHNQWWLSYL